MGYPTRISHAVPCANVPVLLRGGNVNKYRHKTLHPTQRVLQNFTTSGEDVGTTAVRTSSTHPCTGGKHRADPNRYPATITGRSAATDAGRRGRWVIQHKHILSRRNSAAGSAETDSRQMIQRDNRGHIRMKGGHDF